MYKTVLYVIFVGIFDISFEYVSKNGTGTGQILLELLTVDKIPIGYLLFPLFIGRKKV